jgi:hypothetical protein
MNIDISSRDVLYNEEYNDMYFSPDIFPVIKDGDEWEGKSCRAYGVAKCIHGFGGEN